MCKCGLYNDDHVFGYFLSVWFVLVDLLLNIADMILFVVCL